MAALAAQVGLGHVQDDEHVAVCGCVDEDEADSVHADGRRPFSSTAKRPTASQAMRRRLIR